MKLLWVQGWAQIVSVEIILEEQDTGGLKCSDECFEVWMTESLARAI